ncbi:MAG: CBS domain-containing protein [Firmicutes bacterium]|nr:CBS domain-containing protein [Bacillota bacterium]
MKMQLSERFIMAYNKIDRQLEKRAGIEGYMGFSQLVRRVARADPMFAEFEDDLLEYAELRNAIVHELVEPARIIAEPHASVVERIEQIAAILERPPLVIPRFERQVYTVQADDSILRVMDLIRQYGYTQFPVYDGESEFLGLLTDRCLARWLTFEFETLAQGLQATQVAQVMVYDKTEGANVTFLSQNATVFDAYHEFECHMATEYPRLEAILITANGRSDERLMGIITPWDMFRLGPRNGV